MSGQLIDAIYNTLIKDAEFLALFNLTLASTAEQKTGRIIRGMEPDRALTGENVPQVLIYQKPGRYGANYLVYEGKFCFDIFAKSASQAREIAGRAFKLFHDQHIQDDDFRSYRCFLAYDADFATGISGVKGYEAIYDVDYYRATESR